MHPSNCIPRWVSTRNIAVCSCGLPQHNIVADTHIMWYFVGTAMCWWNWTGSGGEVSCSTMCCSGKWDFFDFKITDCSWGFRFSQRCCWRFTFSGILRRLGWLAAADVSNDRTFLIHRIEQSKIQLGYFFDCWVLNMRVLLYYIRNQQDATLAVAFISHCKITLHVSDTFCFHHQEY